MSDPVEETRPIAGRGKRLQVPDMSGACLKGARLRRANLAGAILHFANLRASDLRGANLRKAGLSFANLKLADLGGSNLGMSDLRHACLEQANLCRVNLNQANLLGARLAGARLDNVDLAGAILPDGTHYSDETNLERFINEDNPAFAATLEAVNATEKKDSAAQEREGVAGDSDLSWAQFVERTYGSLADDPIEWRPPIFIESEDTRE
ncbi:MAG: pentapeptide repeat-containing protein [Chloroflexi bacterium]|nr:pentapeptide repeat-containing protein [Chloroflexota bacterium]MCY3980045.1 pentapeptide repeat-containing protein [Chloroflexota bacterium]